MCGHKSHPNYIPFSIPVPIKKNSNLRNATKLNNRNECGDQNGVYCGA